MDNFGRGNRFVARFVEHSTFEIEVEARDAEQAITRAAGRMWKTGIAGFSLVDRETTGWTAVAREAPPHFQPLGHQTREQIVTVELSTSAADWRRPTARMMTSAELQVILKLLDELRETTLSRETFAESENVLELIRPR